MKNPNPNLILKIAILIWALLMGIVLAVYWPKEMKSNSLETPLNLIQENSIQNRLQEIKNEVPQSTPTPEPMSPEYFYYLSDYERWLVECIVCGEAGNQPYEGKVAVANCILNACLLENKRPEQIQIMYGYAGWKSLEEFRAECMVAYGNTNLADEISIAVSQVFDDGEILNPNILWFCSGYSAWHESQRYVMTIGDHRFFGAWS